MRAFVVLVLGITVGGCGEDVGREANSPLCPDEAQVFEAYGHPACGEGAAAGLECRYAARACERGERPDNICHCGAGNVLTCEGHLRSCLPFGDTYAMFRDGVRPSPVHRATQVACVDPDTIVRACTQVGSDFAPDCAADRECDADQICLRTHVFGNDNSCECHPVGCIADADCGAGALCECGTVDATNACGGPYDGSDCSHRCVAAECRSDAECGTAGWCSPSPPMCWGPPTVWACHDLARDECLTDAECARSEDGPQCLYREGAWRCGGTFCVE